MIILNGHLLDAARVLFNLLNIACFFFTYLLNATVRLYNISTFATLINNFTWHLIGFSLLAAFSPSNKTRKAFIVVRA